MFRDDKTSFLTVCAPTESSVDVAAFFMSEFERRSLPSAGIVVNQVHYCSGQTHDADAVLGAVARELAVQGAPAVPAAVVARLGMAHRRLYDLTVAERVLTTSLREQYKGDGSCFYQEVPRLDEEVNDLQSLQEVGSNLFGADAVLL